MRKQKRKKYANNYSYKGNNTIQKLALPLQTGLENPSLQEQ